MPEQSIDTNETAKEAVVAKSAPFSKYYLDTTPASQMDLFNF